MRNVITSVNDLNFKLSDIPNMQAPSKVLVVDPSHFTVEYVINPHMKDHIGSVDKDAAYAEWAHLKEAYQSVGLETHVLEGQQGLPDMVFCANQSLPYISESGNKKVIMSIMHADQRKPEVAHVQKWYEGNGYEIIELDSAEIHDFEGMGDAIWHYGKKLIWGGYGFRSSLDAYSVVSETYEVPIIALELLDNKFYHLDTCFCSLDENSALIYPEAFTNDGLELIHALIPNVIEASTYEAEQLFACNATSADGKNVFIQEGCTEVNNELEKTGFVVHQFSTGEYLKSGGSVFCMKMMAW